MTICTIWPADHEKRIAARIAIWRVRTGQETTWSDWISGTPPRLRSLEQGPVRKLRPCGPPRRCP